MGFSFLGDENLDPMDEFEKCPRGTYKINGITKWISSDENDNPVWEYDELRQDLVVKCELRRVDGETGPAWSGTPLDMSLLVRAFGGDIHALPKKKNTTEFLVKAEALIDKSNGTVTAEVGDKGWVSYIHEATPPEGYYQVKLVYAQSLDGSVPLTFQKGQFGDHEQLKLWFEIVGNMLGNETPYDGYRFIYYLKQGFDGTHEGKPNLLMTQKGAKSYSARRVEKLADIFAPEVLEADYGWKNPENPIDEILNVAIEAERVAIGHYTYNSPRPPRKPRLVLDFDSLAPVDEVPETQEPETDESDVPPNLFALVEWIHGGEPKAFVSYPPQTVEDIQLTDAGKKWANKHMAKLMIDAQLEPKAKPLAEFTEEECAALMGVVWGGGFA